MNMMSIDLSGKNNMDEMRDVPPEWQRLAPSRMSGLIMIVGAPDTGKTTLFRYLVSRLSSIHGRVFAIDADPGQGRLGPPTMISLEIIEGSGGRHVSQNIWHRFVGSTTPAGHMLQVVAGCGCLVQKARELGNGPIVMDTSGLVDPQKGGAQLKFAKIDLLRPSVLMILQHAQELENWVKPLRICQRVSMIDLTCVSAVRQRNFIERQTFREESFREYFKNAEKQTFYWPRYGVFPYPRFYLNGLLGFEDKAGFAPGLGIIKDFDIASKTVSVFTPLAGEDLYRISGMQLGDVVLDPSTFKHSLTHPQTPSATQSRSRF